MLAITQEPEFAVITASGKLTREDYDAFVPAFERVARERGKLPLLIDATRLEGWDIQALWEDLRFSLAHKQVFGPMAVIGDKRWLQWAVSFSKPFFGTEMQFFQPQESADARRWLANAAKPGSD